MALRLDVMYDGAFRKDILDTIREQVRPVVREIVLALATEQMVKREIEKAVHDDLPRRVAREVINAESYRLNYDRDVSAAIQARVDQRLKESAYKFQSADIEQIVRNTLAKILSNPR